LSCSAELRLRLRWAALLYGQVNLDIALTGGVHTGADALKAILAGANVAMVASALLKHGPAHLTIMLDEMRSWLEARDYNDLNALRGKLSPTRTQKAAAFERANYIQVLSSYKEDQ
jgi:dihydroorotate dehydrogenase (fumarate)